ncbi:hypothetical protein L596_024776 [Steinernema carpocapsae]|uniref:Uncharacterized protein n=1 Tax=Steinernema carpocapsae TaxID=34508 RepID=A0A4U5M5Q8_STECR|nr:hypothetical protein L596_024776 [Steinernema carpocapsae]
MKLLEIPNHFCFCVQLTQQDRDIANNSSYHVTVLEPHSDPGRHDKLSAIGGKAYHVQMQNVVVRQVFCLLKLISD